MSAPNTELVFAIVAPVGVEKDLFVSTLKKELEEYDYEVENIKLSDLLVRKEEETSFFSGSFKKIYELMSSGNKVRQQDESLLAKFAIHEIRKSRQSKPVPSNNQKVNRVAYLVDSLKHSKEQELLRSVYGDGFYLLGLSTDSEKRRENLLSKRGSVSIADAGYQVQRLMDLDLCDELGYGQQVVDVFHKADYFFNDVNSASHCKNSTSRFLELVFNAPYVTPTFSEYAMYMAYAASTKSSDMSRQVGAVVARGDSVLSLGANEVPKSGGGTYWPQSYENGIIDDIQGGRDYTIGIEANRTAINDISERILESLKSENVDVTKSNLDEALDCAGVTALTEFGRMLHAEMDALLDCSKRGVSVYDATMFVTTFPCHNCAKHIIGSGVSKVYYIEPYSKSRALQLHSDSLANKNGGKGKVEFLPFSGLGPRYYMDLFSINLSRGDKKIRKSSDKRSKVDFLKKEATPRLKMQPFAYLAIENLAVSEIQHAM